MCQQKAIIFMVSDGYSYSEICEKLKVKIHQIRWAIDKLYDYLMIDNNIKYKSKLLPLYVKEVREYLNEKH